MTIRQIGMKNTEGALPWIVKIIGGGVIVFLLGLHFIVNHLVAPGGLLSYTEILNYYSNPIIPIIEGIFLFFVILHAMLGLRSIILDLNPAKKLMTVINWGLAMIGIASFIYGIWLLIVVSHRAIS
jgi:succinate dehydrogenase hydrophobic anchor subunit